MPTFSSSEQIHEHYLHSLLSIVFATSELLPHFVDTGRYSVKMHLMYNEDPSTGKRTYTLKKVMDGVVTKSAHPARFSPDDKYSRYER